MGLKKTELYKLLKNNKIVEEQFQNLYASRTGAVDYLELSPDLILKRFSSDASGDTLVYTTYNESSDNKNTSTGNIRFFNKHKKFYDDNNNENKHELIFKEIGDSVDYEKTDNSLYYEEILMTGSSEESSLSDATFSIKSITSSDELKFNENLPSSLKDSSPGNIIFTDILNFNNTNNTIKVNETDNKKSLVISYSGNKSDNILGYTGQDTNTLDYNGQKIIHSDKNYELSLETVKEGQGIDIFHFTDESKYTYFKEVPDSESVGFEAVSDGVKVKFHKIKETGVTNGNS